MSIGKWACDGELLIRTAAQKYFLNAPNFDFTTRKSRHLIIYVICCNYWTRSLLDSHLSQGQVNVSLSLYSWQKVPTFFERLGPRALSSDVQTMWTFTLDLPLKKHYSWMWLQKQKFWLWWEIATPSSCSCPSQRCLKAEPYPRILDNFSLSCFCLPTQQFACETLTVSTNTELWRVIKLAWNWCVCSWRKFCCFGVQPNSVYFISHAFTSSDVSLYQNN